jgi:predicted CXXCH cytochrome family protein
MIKNIIKKLIYFLILYQMTFSGKSPHLSLLISKRIQPSFTTYSCQACHIVHSSKSIYLSPSPRSISIIEFTTPKGSLSTRDLLCMRCHTDNITLQREFPEIISSLSESCYLGKNMMDDHPLGVSVNMKSLSKNKISLPLGNNKTVLCVTCHEPHQSTFPPLLRLPKNELCLTCHDNINITFDFGHKETECGKCHQLHNTSNSSLVLIKETLNECSNCHSNPHTGLSTKLKPQDFLLLEFKNPFIQEQIDLSCLKCHKFHKKMDQF